MNIVISEFIHPVALEILASHDVVYDVDLFRRPDDLRKVLSRAQALIVRNKTPVDADLLGYAPNLRVVGRLGVGIDNIRQNLLAEKAIRLILPKGANAISVAEYVIGMAISFQRHLWQMTAQTREGNWDRDMSGLELAGRTLGIVGYGATGQQVAVRAQALGMRLKIYDPRAPVPSQWAAENLEELLRAADVVSLHVPLTPKTFHLLNEKTLAILPRHALLINTARGELIDEAALLIALRTQNLGGAILDVRALEPPAPGDEIAALPNVFSTPHVAGLTEDSQIAIARYVAQGINDVINQER